MATTQAAVYKIENLITAQVYIGASKDIVWRFRRHRYLLRKKIHFSKKLQGAWDEYGEGAFSFSVLEIVGDLTILLSREHEWMDKFQASIVGYNTMPLAGKAKGRRLSVETKAKLSALAKGRIPSDEARKNMGAWKRPPMSDERKKEMSEARKGKVVSDETKAKMSDAAKKRVLSAIRNDRGIFIEKRLA